ncbi:MAG: glycosyltransferase, partial [Alphaproteobacteria bacterium]
MRVLFVTTHPYLPLFYGGSEMSAHHLANHFAADGHHVAVLSSLRNRRNMRALRYRLAARLASGIAHDRMMGYSVYRAWRPENHIATIVRREASDIAILQAGRQNDMAKAVIATGTPFIYYLRDLGFSFTDADRSILQHAAFVANSRYTARVFHERTGRTAAVIPPLVIGENYRNPGPGDKVLFVNPNHQKGVDIALQLAERNPDIPFLFIEGWGLPKDLQSVVRARARALANLIWKPSTANMKAVYAQARIVLMPTGTPFQGQPVDFVETWGRVATEAQFSGIPVIATNRGGLPESVGDGGILIDAGASIETWHDALRRLWADRDFYAACSARARRHADREEIKPERLFARLFRICLETASAMPALAPPSPAHRQAAEARQATDILAASAPSAARK